MAEQHTQLAHSQAELAEQLRAQYASGLSPWTALLSGNDPQAIGRDLSYLGYVSKARADTVRAIERAIDKLAALRKQSQDKAQELEQVSKQVAQQKADLQEQEKERRRVLERIDAQLVKQRAQASSLAHHEKRLGGLIASLEQAIAEQAKARRRAEEKRKAEAARKARQERQAAKEREEQIGRAHV